MVPIELGQFSILAPVEGEFSQERERLRMSKKMVILINPPNSNTVIPGQTHRVNNPAEHSDWSNYPATGILVLASALKSVPNVEPVYIDGVVVSFSDILAFISLYRNQIAAIAISALTDTYEAGLRILEHARKENPCIIHLIGNDHFTALPELCLENRASLIDFGFVGNEVIHSFQQLVDLIVNHGQGDPLTYPGIVFQKENRVVRNLQSPEPIFHEIDYTLLDRFFPHTARYDSVFQSIFPAHIQKWFGQSIHRGIAIEIARGCVKFKNDDACSFCSIQYGGMWKNCVPAAADAWNVIHRAYEAGYDYFYITADELTLTFRQLLFEMKESRPEWLVRLSVDQKPVLTGYARADGIAVEKNADLLYDLGFRVIMIGVDAGPKLSLQAVNKHFNGGSTVDRIDQLYEANRRAFAQAAKAGLKLRIGFVVGHIGMTKELLRQNVAYFCDLVRENPNVVCTADIEILSPEPGSKDYIYLLNSNVAQQKAGELGLEIAEPRIRQAIAAKWQNRDIIVREELVTDYVTAQMPELSLVDLITARKQMRDFCLKQGILIGEG